MKVPRGGFLVCSSMLCAPQFSLQPRVPGTRESELFLSPETVARMLSCPSSMELNLKVFFPIKEVSPPHCLKYISTAAQVRLGLGPRLQVIRHL